MIAEAGTVLRSTPEDREDRAAGPSPSVGVAKPVSSTRILMPGWQALAAPALRALAWVVAQPSSQREFGRQHDPGQGFLHSPSRGRARHARAIATEWVSGTHDKKQREADPPRPTQIASKSG